MFRLGPDVNSRQGVLFKAQFTNDSNVSGYFAGYDRQGHAQLERFDNFNVVSNTGSRTTLCSGKPSLSGDNYNTVVVSTRGSQHTLSINGQLICAKHDSTYGTGSAGILGYFATAGAGNAFAVDEFVLQPAEVVPLSGPADDLIVAAEPPT
jgi:hypothetical protein